ncbi:DUF2637 domain-containing protein [Kitasatospora aburaviensis]
MAAVAAVGLGVRTALARRPAPAVLTTEEHEKKLRQDQARVTQAREAWRRRLVVWTLALSFLLSFVIAIAAAWLSFGNQRQYALGANGNHDTEATVFALLLDAGALAFSLMRLFEAITARSSNLTRAGLATFIAGSTTMNLLHAHHAPGQAPTIGAILYVVIPPLVYAALLEMLLWKTEQLVLGKFRKSTPARGYSLLMWLPWPIGFPIQLWRAWRNDLRETLPNVRAPMSTKPLPSGAEPTAVEQAQAQESTAPDSPSGALDPAPAAPAMAVATPGSPRRGRDCAAGSGPAGCRGGAHLRRTPGPGRDDAPRRADRGGAVQGCAGSGRRRRGGRPRRSGRPWDAERSGSRSGCGARYSRVGAPDRVRGADRPGSGSAGGTGRLRDSA